MEVDFKTEKKDNSQILLTVTIPNIEIKKELFKVRNLLKFSSIVREFNKSWNGFASIGLYGAGIILNIKYNQLPSENSEIMKTLLENFTIEEKENSLYLQPKFEFIVYDK